MHLPLYSFLYNNKKEILKQIRFIPYRNFPVLHFENNFFFFHNSEFQISHKFFLTSAVSISENSINTAPTKLHVALNSNLILNENLLINFFEKFTNFKKYSFTNIFIDNLIDVPICFKKSPSLKRNVFSQPSLKLINYFTRTGKKEKSYALLTQIFYKLNVNLINNSIKNKNLFTIKWFLLTLTLTNTKFCNYENSVTPAFNKIFTATELPDSNTNNLQKIIKKTTMPEKNEFFITLENNNLLTEEGKKINIMGFYKNIFKFFTLKINPIFSFFVYNVDKNIKKFSRGKSGKYVFLWKYVPPYKRHLLIMRWLYTDIKFINNKSYKSRIYDGIFNILTQHEKSFVYQSKIFAHNYVFKAFKKTLITNYKTTT